ncbi:MAG: sugar phosphate isomerase/epimerase family protein [Luteolibacter sp.]
MHPFTRFTGFADEASRDLEKQIQATKELGWSAISARMIGGHNIHDLPEEDFQNAADRLDEEGIQVVEFGSLIANWGKKISGDFDVTLAEVDRAIPRMKRLGTSLVRIMSYAQEPWGEDQHEAERFRRLREIVRRFDGAGITAAHENCMNWGGFSAQHSLRLIDEVPGLKLIFDTGNPVFQRDRSKSDPQPWQDPMEFWRAVREHVVHIHIKDCRNPVADGVEPEYTMPGEGDAKVAEILSDAFSRGYTGFIAIEPHVATVFHEKDPERVNWQQCYDSYVEYGQRMAWLVATLD